MKHLYRALLLAFALIAVAAYGSEENNGTFKRYYGSGVNTGDTLFTATNTSEWDACNLSSSTGSVTVDVSLDGTNWIVSITVEDYHSTDPATDHVAATTAAKMYGFVGKFKAVRLKQNGATAAAASMNCWSQGQSRSTPQGGV
jgi:hypothetical protein